MIWGHELSDAKPHGHLTLNLVLLNSLIRAEVKPCIRVPMKIIVFPLVLFK